MKNIELEFICDDYRHLVCLPYSIDNLHIMADRLQISRHWFHKKANHSHYDIPKKRMEEIMGKCRKVSSKELIKLIS